MIKKLLLVTLIVAALAGCNLPSRQPPTSTPVAVSASDPLIVVAPPDATPTATPFMPVGPTDNGSPVASLTPGEGRPTRVPLPTLTPTFANPWADYDPPSVTPDVTVPPPMGVLPQPDNQLNFLLLGSDRRPDTGGFRTDTMLLVTVNTDLKTVNITSFPRDLYIYIPGWTMQRLNTAFPHGGFDTMQDTFEYNFGVRPDYYMLINFQSFVDVVDSLGGLNVYVGRTFTDHRDGHGDYTVYAGSNHMDGETALWYVRARYSSSDFDRTRRQQEVIMALFYRFLSLDAITRAPQLYETYSRNVETNIPFDKVAPLVTLIPSVSNGEGINQYFIGSSNVDHFRTSTGAAVLLPHSDEIKGIMEKALNIEK